jgi:signal peptidase I
LRRLGLFSDFAIGRKAGGRGRKRIMAERKTGEGPSLAGAGRTFVKEILVPILLALVVIQFVIQAFKIPSASMEDSLLIGDFLLGLKFVYGSPLPFSHHKLPGLTDPKPGDVLIFKYPGDPEYPEGDKAKYKFLANLFLFGNLYWDRHPQEGQKHLVWYMPKDFIKRCVAQSGQTITVSGTRLLIDGKESPLPRKGKHKNERGYDPQRDSLAYRLPAPGETLDLDTLPLKQAVWIRSLAYQENPDSDVRLQLDLMRDSTVDNDYILPYLNGDPRNQTHGAVYALLNLPYEQKFEGSTLYVHSENIPFKLFQDAARYGFIRTNELPAFRTWDPGDPAAVKAHNDARRVENNEYFLGSYLEFVNLNIIGQSDSLHHYRIRPSLVIDGKRTTKYTVKKKCFFMMGDNRDNSSDSRYWGQLSKDFVKAKAFIIYFSFENDDDRFRFTNPLSWTLIPQKIRWSRIGKLID